jgi:hypothetical protein
MEDITQSLFTTAARLATFHTEHRLEKRRASSQKKKQTNTLSWPHDVPTPEDVCALTGMKMETNADDYAPFSLRAPGSTTNHSATATTT